MSLKRSRRSSAPNAQAPGAHLAAHRRRDSACRAGRRTGLVGLAELPDEPGPTRRSIAYQRGMEALQTGNTAGAETAFAEAAKAGNGAYKALALQQRAGLAVTANRIPRGHRTVRRGRQGRRRPDPARHGRLKAALLMMDNGATLEQLEARLEPLAKEGRPLLPFAQEALGMARLQFGKPAEAREVFVLLTLGQDVPDSVRQRAQAAIGMIDTGVAAGLPAIVAATVGDAARRTARAHRSAALARRSPGRASSGRRNSEDPPDDDRSSDDDRDARTEDRHRPGAGRLAGVLRLGAAHPAVRPGTERRASGHGQRGPADLGPGVRTAAGPVGRSGRSRLLPARTAGGDVLADAGRQRRELDRARDRRAAVHHRLAPRHRRGLGAHASGHGARRRGRRQGLRHGRRIDGHGRRRRHRRRGLEGRRQARWP